MKLLFLALAGLKLGKVTLTAGSMLLSLAIYAQIWGWQFAAGFVTLLFMHEIGHVGAARVRGLAVGAPAFIPFVGAFITLRDLPPDAEVDAYVAYGGPFIGTLAAFAAYFWARNADSQLGLAVAYSGFFLNLFNMLPLMPLDGGRITAVLGPRIWLLGAPIMLAFMLYQPSPLLIIIALLALPHLIAAWRYDPSLPESQRFYGLPGKTKFEYAVLYLGLLVLLALMTTRVHELLAGVHGGVHGGA